jgi:hypothetical protein
MPTPVEETQTLAPLYPGSNHPPVSPAPSVVAAAPPKKHVLPKTKSTRKRPKRRAPSYCTVPQSAETPQLHQTARAEPASRPSASASPPHAARQPSPRCPPVSLSPSLSPSAASSTHRTPHPPLGLSCLPPASNSPALPRSRSPVVGPPPPLAPEQGGTREAEP